MRGSITTFILATFLSLGFSFGCGTDFQVGNGGLPPAPKKFQLTKEKATSLALIGDNSQRLMRFGGGVKSLTPDINEVFASAGLGGGTAAGVAPGFGPQSASDQCPPDNSNQPLPSDGICFGTEVQQNPEPGVDSLTQRFVIYIPDAAHPTTAFAIDYTADKNYSDGSTGVLALIDQQFANGTTAADLGRHLIEATEQRFYTIDSEIAVEQGTIGLNFNGTSDDSPQSERDAANDSTDVIFYARFAQELRDGTTTGFEIWPSSPLSGDQDPAAGKVTSTATYPTGPLKSSLETFTWDSIAKTASGRNELDYTDGTTEFEAYAVSATWAAVNTAGRRGERQELGINLVTGDYVQNTDFPNGSDVVSIRESGRITEGAGGTVSIVVSQTTVFADGRSVAFDGTINTSAIGRTTIDYTQVSDEGTETGSLVIVEGIASNSISGTVNTSDGLIVTVDAVQFADGTTDLKLTVDAPATEPAPDWSAELRIYPDGTVTGTLTADGTTVDINSLDSVE